MSFSNSSDDESLHFKVTIFAEDYVASVPSVEKWFEKHQIIPQEGQGVRLPRSIRGRSDGEDAEIDLSRTYGLVDGIYYVPSEEKVEVILKPQEWKGTPKVKRDGEWQPLVD